MRSRSTQSSFTSINDFGDKCRICLKNYTDMVDIFASGISNQMMEVTNVKVSCNDKLPKNMCQNCSTQLKEFHKFQCLAKDSDKYLRELLKAEEILEPQFESLSSKKIGKKKRKLCSKHVRLKCSENANVNLEAEKIYLILVTDSSKNTGSQNEICIKYLDVDNENTELTDLCKSLIKNQSCDNRHLDDHESLFHKTQNKKATENIDNDIYNVNLFIYNCRECDKSFEFEDNLTEHLISCHKSNVSSVSFCYTCPVCLLNQSDKNLFINHLNEHKKEGFKFFKVDGKGNQMTLINVEKEIFDVPNLTKESIIRNKIYKMNTNSFKCILCKKVESVSSVHEHLKLCFPDFSKNDDLLLHTKYTCPACCESWIDGTEEMNAHLASHTTDNVFFVKVNDSGEAIDLTQEDIGYTEFEKALQILCGNNEGINRDTKLRTIDYSCGGCDFKAVSVSSLSEHYMENHEVVKPTTKMPCPVCSETFHLGSDENVKFLDHLRCHKSEGFVFVKIHNDGSLNGDSDNSGLFSDLSELYNGRVSCSELEFISDVHVPEVYLESSSGKDRGGSQCKESSGENDGGGHLKIDVEDANRSNQEYVCEKCGRKCLGRGNYKRHFMTHAEKTGMSLTPKRPSCSVCSKTFSNRAALNEHKKHHGNPGNDDESGRKVCEVCGRRFSSNASLAKHRKLHGTDRETSLFKCKICGRGFRRELTLKKHVSYHLNPNYFECEVCKLPLPSSARLERHKQWHQDTSNTYDCKVCKVSFLTKDRLTAHQTHTGHHQDRKFECNVCHERFFIGREFSQHIKLHPKYKMSECSLCGKRLSTMQSLMLHVSRHFESNSILCPHCGKLFFEEKNYHRHLLTHKGVKPFSCDFEACKKSFYTYFELNRHKKYHNNTRDFSCPYCPKSFHEANHLKVHIRTHTGERPYTCPHCNKGFVTRTRCKQHINLIHQGVGCDLIQSNISKKVAVFEALETIA